MCQLTLGSIETKMISTDEYAKREKAEREKHLWKWVDYLKKNLGVDFDFWFDLSKPCDEEINVRIKGHKCIECFSLRFENGKLDCYDSDFDGGTSSCFCQTEEQEKNIVNYVMKHVRERRCENACWDSRYISDKDFDARYKVLVREDKWIRRTGKFNMVWFWDFDENNNLKNYGDDGK